MLAWEPSRSFQGCSNHDALKRSVRECAIVGDVLLLNLNFHSNITKLRNSQNLGADFQALFRGSQNPERGPGC